MHVSTHSCLLQNAVQCLRGRVLTSITHHAAASVATACTMQWHCRALTGPTPGLTRDAVAVEWEWDGRPVRLVDTAGIRR